MQTICRDSALPLLISLRPRQAVPDDKQGTRSHAGKGVEPNRGNHSSAWNRQSLRRESNRQSNQPISRNHPAAVGISDRLPADESDRCKPCRWTSPVHHLVQLLCAAMTESMQNPLVKETRGFLVFRIIFSHQNPCWKSGAAELSHLDKYRTWRC